MVDLKKALNSAKLGGLVRQAPTRWRTIQECLKSLRAADNVLSGLVSQCDFTTIRKISPRENRAAIKGIITDPDFVNKLEECIKKLHPIDTLINVF